MLGLLSGGNLMAIGFVYRGLLMDVLRVMGLRFVLVRMVDVVWLMVVWFMCMIEYPPINLDYQRVNDAGWTNSDSLVVSACEKLCRGDGGMGLFSTSAGELRYKFHVTHENHVTYFRE